MSKQMIIPDNINDYNFYDLYRKESNSRTRVRLLGMAHIQEGQSCSKVGTMLKVSRSTVRRWVERFDKEGLSGLLDKPGRGAKQKLPAADEEAFKEAVCRLQNDNQNGRVTGEDIQQMLADRFNVHYSLNGVYELLRRLEVVWIVNRLTHAGVDSNAQVYSFRTKHNMNKVHRGRVNNCCGAGSVFAEEGEVG